MSNIKPIETSELVYKYERGASAAELSAEYGISKVAILNRLRQVGITIRGRGARAGGQKPVPDITPLSPPPLGLRQEEYP